MPSGLGSLVIKEVKELLRDPKILIGMVLMPLLIFPVMGVGINISQTAVAESVKSAQIAVLDLDHGSAAQNLTAFLWAFPNVTIMEVNASSVDIALSNLRETNVTVLLVIPQGFSDNVTNNFKGKLEFYAIFRSVSMAETGKSEVAERLISTYRELLVPIDVSYSTVVKDKVVNVHPDILSAIMMSQSIMFPMVIMLLLIFAMQIAATSIAIEKEEKTLETLLTLPVGRLSILTGKLAGSVLVAVAGAVASIIGVTFYVGAAFSGFSANMPQGLDLQALGLAPSTEAYVLLGLSIFVTIVSSLALAICMAVFSENVRSAQTLVGYLNLPIIAPAIILMFADMEILPPAVQVVLYAIPFTHSITAAKAAFLGNYSTVFVSIAYISLFTLVILYVAAKIFTSEKVVTARISLKKLKLRK
jgi:ABC-2 type transport system permease protein